MNILCKIFGCKPDPVVDHINFVQDKKYKLQAICPRCRKLQIMKTVTTKDGQTIQCAAHTWNANWFQKLWYKLTWRIEWLCVKRPSLAEDNLCTLEELLGDKFDENSEKI